MPLVVARGALLEQILDVTFPVWNEGLTRKAYGQLNDAQLRTEWGSRHLARIALVDDGGALLASAKRYRFHATLSGKPVTMCGIGALFTAPERRGRGHAGRLVEQLVAAERDGGADLALLFSEIGTTFYERLSFTPVPVDEVELAVDPKGGGSPAMLVRAGVESDLAAVAAMHDVRSATAAFSLRRDPSLLRFMLARKRMRAGLAPPGLRSVEFHVAEEGASAVAYVVMSVNEHGWTIDEAGDRDPAAARLGAILQVLLAREPSLTPPVIRAWWPRAFATPPQVTRARQQASRDVMMMRSLSGVAVPSSAGDVFYWRGDVF